MVNNLFFMVFNFALIITTSTVQAALPQSDFGPKIQAVQEKIHSTCISKSGTDENTISTVVSGVFPNDPKIKVYARCMLDQIKAINENGAIDGEVIINILPDKILPEGSTNTKICIERTSDITNLEDKVYSFFKCIYEVNSNFFIFF